MRIPEINFDAEHIREFVGNPKFSGAAIMHGILLFFHIATMNYILSAVIPMPVMVTWIQVLLGTIYLYVYGEAGREFPKLAFFQPVKLDKHKIVDMIIPGALHVAMLVFNNLLLTNIASVANFPVAAAIVIVFHHLLRFVGFGEVYSPFRWVSVLTLLAGFIIGCFANEVVGKIVFLAVAHGLVTALYRACYHHRAMHIFQCNANLLHVHYNFLAIVTLPLLIMLVPSERKFFRHMPNNFTDPMTWCTWGCLFTAAALPILKNITGNRLVRLTGQIPWRAIEIAVMNALFITGCFVFGSFTPMSGVAFGVVLIGRSMNAWDATSKAKEIDWDIKFPRPQTEAFHANEFAFDDLEWGEARSNNTPSDLYYPLHDDNSIA